MACGGDRSEFCDKPCLSPECGGEFAGGGGGVGGGGIAGAGPIGGGGVGGTAVAFDMPNPFLGQIEYTGLTEMPEPEEFQQGPYIGMRDSKDPAAANPRYAYNLQNLYPLDPEINAGWEGRPGFDQAGGILGSSGKRTAQLIHQYTQLDGTEITCAIFGGKLYTYDWSGDAWTDKSAGQSTTSETARCWAVTFADKLLVTDGTNVPWTWDDTTFTALTNAPVAYGPPTLYYAKVFFVKNTERSTLVWSEENDPTTGYEAGGFNNAWTLGQTDQDPIERMAGTNYALIVFRGRSTTSISGQVTTNFTSSGTNDGISSTIGTTSDVVQSGDNIYFRDADYRPWVLAVANRAISPLIGLQETYPGWDNSNFLLETAFHLPGMEVVGLTVTETGETYPNKIIAIDNRSQEVIGLWAGFDSQTSATVRDGDGVPVLMHGTASGYAYKHGTSQGTLWDDEDNAATAAIEHIIEASAMGYDAKTAKRFWQIIALLRLKSAVTLDISHSTPNRTSTPVEVTTTHTGSDWTEDRVVFGSYAYGRWIRPKITHQVVGEQFGFDGWMVRAASVTDHAKIY